MHDVDGSTLAMVSVLSWLQVLGMLVQLLLEFILLQIQLVFLGCSLLSLELSPLLSKSSSLRLIVRHAQLLSQKLSMVRINVRHVGRFARCQTLASMFGKLQSRCLSIKVLLVVLLSLIQSLLQRSSLFCLFTPASLSLSLTSLPAVFWIFYSVR